MRTETRITGIVAAVFGVLLAAVVLVVVVQREDGGAAPATGDPAVAAAGRVLGEPAGDDAVTLVEFLDFECESCAAAYPLVEQLRETYEGDVTFVLRYFPLPGHANSRNAAWAVEAAARQGALEPMYRRMYETQAQWGEQRESRAALFRTFAADLELDLERYDTDVASDEVRRRVEADYRAGLELGVEGTPTFFLDGERLAPTTIEEFVGAVDDAVTR